MLRWTGRWAGGLAAIYDRVQRLKQKYDEVKNELVEAKRDYELVKDGLLPELISALIRQVRR